MKILTPRPISLWLPPIETGVLMSLMAFSAQLLVTLATYRQICQLVELHKERNAKL